LASACLVWSGLSIATGQAAQARAPRELDGRKLGVIPRHQVTYTVKQEHVRNGGRFPGRFVLTADLMICVDSKRLKLAPNKLQGRSALPVVACVTNFDHARVDSTGKERSGTLPSIYSRLKWDEKTGDIQFHGGVYSCSPSGSSVLEPIVELHTLNAWLAALDVRFPRKLALRKGFTWGDPPKQTPTRHEDVSYLQHWTLAGFEEDKGRGLLRLTAATTDGKGHSMRREVRYDTGRKLVVRAAVIFERKDQTSAEKVSVTIELGGKR